MFGDVDGWDLQHVRRVRWLWRYNDKANKKSGKKAKEFAIYTLKQGDTTQLLKEGPVLAWLKSLNLPAKELTRQVKKLPREDVGDFNIDQLAEFLFDGGVASSSIESLLNEIDELIRIAKWYRNFGKPSESETVTYLAVPLLRALGWTPQKMAIEWNHVDIALFASLPRDDENLKVVVEAKKMGNSCLTAVSQAEAYAESRSGCKRLIVTDGIRYGIYVRKKSGFSLHAYMNLTNLRKSYPILKCGGVNDAILAMTPEWRS
jgi:hypothetical protein